jgi:pyruvate/2-oxoglutarate/acetoin dehydrogenase E1 component/TPP-dependent pyruvate/acetoin dehydrogenase alpha subunit
MASVNGAGGKRTLDLSNSDILKDYEIAYKSRVASLIGRAEVLSGKAKFGIFGDGKEVAQVAMARAFEKGDWRSGYYRDQTFMLAIGAITIQQFFSQLYADTDLTNEPASGGRQMNCHFSSRNVDLSGEWNSLSSMYNCAADLSPTAGQMPRMVGLGYASKLYRESAKLQAWADYSKFSKLGNEVVFGTIGNASTSEGIFWETMNAAGVLQIPLAMSIWDDAYGISVPAKYHTTKESISEALAGFQSSNDKKGFDIYVIKGWDYQNLVMGYRNGIAKTRREHTPSLFHIIEMTQPQGHSTSGSHERYKPKTRLDYEVAMDCIKIMREWMIENSIATVGELTALEAQATIYVEGQKELAWKLVTEPIIEERRQATAILHDIANLGSEFLPAKATADRLVQLPTLSRRNIHAALDRCLLDLRYLTDPKKNELIEFVKKYDKANRQRYNTHLVSETKHSPLAVVEVKPSFGATANLVDGRQVIQKYFDIKFASDPRIFMIGEDVGKIGGVNAEFEGLQEKFGELKLTDTGIREATILGQGIGAAMRGLRPVIEIQYLDYLLYCIQTLSDDLASLRYRTAGGQKSPCIIRTRGHRLEGIWHTGSPMSMILGSARGLHICVPRNCAQAAGLYETLLQGDDPALVIEVLNGYRVKEPMPENLGQYSVPLGVPEILQTGTDITVVTYGPNIRIAQDASAALEKTGISIELIDVQTLLPFDIRQIIRQSIEKTNAVIFFDEDVPGGASAFMMQQVLELQNAYEFLDAAPRCLAAQPHRSAYGSDGDYYSKPNAEDLITLAYEIMRERDPRSFPAFK